MKNTFTKLASALLVLLFAVSLGCGRGTEAGSSSTSSDLETYNAENPTSTDDSESGADEDLE